MRLMESRQNSRERPLATKCPSCGYPNRTDSRYCRRCGADMSMPGKPRARHRKPSATVFPATMRLGGIAGIAALALIGSFVLVALLYTPIIPSAYIYLPLVPIVVLAVSALYLAWVPPVLDALGPLGHLLLQRNIHMGWAQAAMAALGWATMPFWARSAAAETESIGAVLSVLMPITIWLTLAAAYGFVVRYVFDDPGFPGFVEDPMQYRRGVSRVAFLGVAGAVIAILATLMGHAEKTGASDLARAAMWPAVVLFAVAVLASFFHIPAILAILARAALERTLGSEGVFFLGEPLKRGQFIIQNAYAHVPADKRETKASEDRGAFRNRIREKLSGIEKIEVSLAKIPVPGKLNIRTGEKEVHKYIQVTYPVHTGVLKAFVSFRLFGEHLVIGNSLYFLGEPSPRAMQANATAILLLNLSHAFSSRSGNLRRNTGSDDSSLPIEPALKIASEMDRLARAPRDEIVDEAAGVIWLGLTELIAEAGKQAANRLYATEGVDHQ